MRLAPRLPGAKAVVVNMSGRGDKDLFITARALDRDRWLAFLKDEVQHG